MSQFDLSEVHFPAGTEFFRARGDVGCFIGSDEIRVWIERDGNEVTLATLDEGELFGELSAIDRSLRLCVTGRWIACSSHKTGQPLPCMLDRIPD